ncbi:conserved hypothetical protein, partial [Ricinus communis]
MAAQGEIGPMPDCAIFADTGWEPKAVYDHLAWLRSPNVLPFPVHIVSAGDLRADLLAGARGERWASIPAFTRTVTPVGAELAVYNEDENGDLTIVGSRVVATERVGIGMIRRQCTGDYKIVPIRRKVRGLLGIAGRRSPKAPAGWRGTIIPCRRKARASAARSIPTIIGGGCVTMIPRPGPMPCRWTPPSAPAFAGFGVMSISIVLRSRSTRPTSRPRPIAASSISGPTSARASAGCDDPENGKGGDGFPAPRFSASSVPWRCPPEEEGGASLRDGSEVKRESPGRPSRSISRWLLPFRRSP